MYAGRSSSPPSARWEKPWTFDQHRLWMRFSDASTFAAVTLRLQIPFGFIFFGFHSYAEMSVWLACISWIPNVIVVALYSLLLASRKRGVAAAGPA